MANAVTTVKAVVSSALSAFSKVAKAAFAAKGHTHAASDIAGGILPAAATVTTVTSAAPALPGTWQLVMKYQVPMTGDDYYWMWKRVS